MSEKDDQMYVYQLFSVSTPRRIKAEKTLRSKIGPVAKIDEQSIIKAQRKIDKPQIDFKPYALDYVRDIEEIVYELRSMDYGREGEYNRIAIPVSQLKGQAGMFGNTFVSDVSAKTLRFLEHYKRLDDDVLSILEAYCRCVKTSYDHYITKTETAEAESLIQELEGAVQRYIAKFRRHTET